MALSNCGFLSPQPHSTVSPRTKPCWKFTFPPKFKFRTPTSINVGPIGKTTTNKVSNPQALLPTIPRNVSDFNPIEGKEHIDYCLSLLQDRISNIRLISDPKQIHAQVTKSGLAGSNNLIGNKVVVLYARNLGLLNDARRLFDQITERTIPAYATLIGSYCRSQLWVDAISVFGLMINEGLQPDKFLLPTILKACSALEALSIGAVVHGYIIRKNLEVDVFVENSLIDMYANCGNLSSSRRIFDMMGERDVVSWTALVSAYVDAGLLDEAVGVFESMQANGVKADLICWNSLISGFARNGEIGMSFQFLEELQEKGLKPGVSSWNGIISGCVDNGYFEDSLDVFGEMCVSESPNAVTLVSILLACSGLKALNLGKEIHSYAIKRDFRANIFVGGSLINMYSKCGRSDYAEKVFEEVKDKNNAVWNEMITAYVNLGQTKEALELLNLMRIDGLKPDLITYNTLLAGYARKGQKDEAFELLLEMSRMNLKLNIVSFNALISGFQQFGLSSEALKLFWIMQLPNKVVMNDSKSIRDFPLEVLNLSVQPNAVTLSSVLTACSNLNLLRQGKEIHGYVLKNWFESNVIISSAMVDMYAKCQDMDSAVKAFHKISDKNTISWNILLAGHNQNKEPEVSLKLFLNMLENGFVPSSITLMIVLCACGNLAALRFGRELHGYILKSGFDEFILTLASALVDMYAKCGSILEARLAFSCTVQKDLALWNAMISGYSTHGMAHDAITLFEQLESSDIKPDNITFTAILSACSHEGLVEEGWEYFNSMEGVYEISPSLEHYTCMVCIMAGAGLLEEALDFMRRMPHEPDACTWATLLRGCRVHSNPKIGELAAKALFELEPTNTSNYIVLSNIYAMAGMWDFARNVRIAMRARGLKMIKACSWIDVNHRIYAFKAGESSQPELEKILETWDKLAEEMEHDGYVPDDAVLHDEEEMDPFSCCHTEKLAICFGIISLHARSPIRISKNIRMCIDCHTSMKFISKIEGREIFVRDGCFYHHFKDGACSCRDKW
ncbi:pentatricopeptide repeat-containing protein At1g20230-like [Tasmannia lanceolata]|uniref:pentatricopeptide repeat-containing protein At1g20230-like n=1 Tax=Tasmannia lanceolata TaxID=3420 RepID=UPI0040634700